MRNDGKNDARKGASGDLFDFPGDYGYFGKGLEGYLHYISAVNRTQANSGPCAYRPELHTAPHEPYQLSPLQKRCRARIYSCLGLLAALYIVMIIIGLEAGGSACYDIIDCYYEVLYEHFGFPGLLGQNIVVLGIIAYILRCAFRMLGDSSK